MKKHDFVTKYKGHKFHVEVFDFHFSVHIITDEEYILFYRIRQIEYVPPGFLYPQEKHAMDESIRGI